MLCKMTDGVRRQELDLLCPPDNTTRLFGGEGKITTWVVTTSGSLADDAVPSRLPPAQDALGVLSMSYSSTAVVLAFMYRVIRTRELSFLRGGFSTALWVRRMSAARTGTSQRPTPPFGCCVPIGTRVSSASTCKRVDQEVSGAEDHRITDHTHTW